MYTGLGDISHQILMAATELDRLRRKKKLSKEGKEYLTILIAKLGELGLDDEQKFSHHVHASLVYWDYLKARDGKEKWEEAQNARIRAVFAAMQKELRNLERIVHGRYGRVKQAYDMCLWLHRRALIERQREHHRFGLAA